MFAIDTNILAYAAFDSADARKRVAMALVAAAALDLVTARQLSWFDALIIATSRRAGATALLTEDMHDGADFDGLRIINPFALHNAPAITALLAG